MKNMLMIVAILFVITTIIELILNNYKKNIYNKLVSLLSLKKYDEFSELIEDRKTKFFLPVNNYHILKMNEAMLQQRTNDIIFEIDKLKNLKLTEEQKTFVYCRAFSYFLTACDDINMNRYYSLVLNLKDSPSKKYTIMVYNTLVEKDYQYIDDATKMLENATGEDKNNLLALLSQMYMNKGDIKTANDYSSMVKGG